MLQTLKKMDKGTVIRTVLLLLAFANQGLAVFGKEALLFSDDQVSILVEMIYYVGSFILTAVAAFVAWFKNNYVTAKGQQQKEVLKANKLTKAK